MHGATGEAAFHRGGELARTSAAFDALAAESCKFLVGHDLLAFDAPGPAAVQPSLKLLRLARIDTLRLEPLAFPRDPCRHLARDCRAGQRVRNDPECDA